MIISTKDGSCLATGTVTKKGGEMKYMGEKQIPKYRFSVRFENKKDKTGEWKSRYIDCELFGENECKNAPKLSGGEMVMCAGHLYTSRYKGNDGEDKESTVLQCDFVAVGGNAAQIAAQMPMQEPSGFQEADDFDDEDPATLPF